MTATNKSKIDHALSRINEALRLLSIERKRLAEDITDLARNRDAYEALEARVAALEAQ